MVEPVSLAEAREHLRIDADETGDDATIGALIITARRTVEKETGRTIVGTDPTLTGDDLTMARQAMLLLIGHWFANREGASADGRASAETPLAVRWLLDLLREWPAE